MRMAFKNIHKIILLTLIVLYSPKIFAETMDESRIAILEGPSAAGLLQQCSRSAPSPGEGWWTPTIADIQKFELHMLEASSTDGEYKNNDTIKKYEISYRQYIGIIRGGKRSIYGSFFRSYSPYYLSNWQSEPIVVCDGGKYQFGVEMDSETWHITHFAFNGR